MGEVLRVLVMEDSPADAELAVRALQAGGQEVDWLRVDTPESFAAAIESHPWDVILADFSVPGFGAAPALEILQESGLEIPLIVVSGSIGEELAVRLLRSGADDFVNKDRLVRLAPAVERAVREARHRREKRQAEQESRVLAERWRLLLDHAIDGVALHQAIFNNQGAMVDFRVLEWNRAAETILGRSREEVIGRTGRELFPTLVSSGWMDRLAEVMATGVSQWIGDSLAESAKGEKILDVSCFRLDSRHLVALFRDVTERKAAERRLREYAAEVARGNQDLEKVNAELERRNAELEEFTHVASHDLQEPLRKVVSFGDLLARALAGQLDARSAKYLKMIQDSTRRLQALLRDLLLMSRADRTPLRLEAASLDECVRSVLDLLSARIQETGAVVEVDPLPTLIIDPAQISQLYQNLISNALKFVPPQGPPVVRITSEPGPDGTVLGVADNGIGIEPEYHEKIFEAFQRLHPREKYDGSGIGLAVCRKIVARHKGRIWVESRLGEGAHFRFVLGTGAAQPEAASWQPLSADPARAPLPAPRANA